MITYKLGSNNAMLDVILDGKRVGTILHLFYGGFQYFPKGHDSGGKVYDNLNDLKNSLES